MAVNAPTLLLTDPLFLEHDPGPRHPESPRRLSHTLELLAQHPVAGVTSRTPRQATPEELLAAHTPAHCEALAHLRGERAELDPDTLMSPRSYDAAVLAAGASSEAVQEVLGGRVRNAFALVRPPGHHAEPGRAMGFCLFNNVAIAAETARRAGVERVLVLDWDVHHGNGTQACFESRRDILYQSVHQFPFYPGTGAPAEVGVEEGKGFTVNCGLASGQSDADYGAVFDELLLPIAQAFRPGLILVSAGFDAHEDDPLGGMLATERGFAAMATRVRRLAEELCGGRLVLLLEGGYSLPGLSRSVHACLEVLQGRNDEFPGGAGADALEAIGASREALRPYWPVLSPGGAR